MGGSVIGAIVIGLLLVVVALVHPIGPGLMLAAETPFDAIPFGLFGVAGNLITFVPILILLVRVNPEAWGQVFLGTRIQQYLALFVMSLLVSHALVIADYGIGEIWEWLRKVTLFMLVGVFTYTMTQTKHLALLMKTMVASMALLTILAMLDFYLGIQVLPLKSGELDVVALEVEYDPLLATNWRFSGPGFPVNRYSNYLLLLIFLGVGWFMSVKGPVQRLIALGCTSILVFAEILTVTRSGILGMVVGFVIMLPLAFRLRIVPLLGTLVVGALVGGLVWYGVSFTSADEVLAKRFEVEHLVGSGEGRIQRLVAAFKIWAAHPFLGVGWGAFKSYSGQYISGGGRGAHNAYTNVLAEAGLLAFIPLMMVTFVVIRQNLSRIGHLSTELEFWRPYFFCGLAAQLVTNVFNDYLWERYLWVNFAFAAALEHCYRAARAKQAAARLEETRAVGGRGSEPFTAGSSVP